MPAKEFKFISPGVFVNEIDNSQLSSTPEGIGPAIIGRAQKGPALVPTQVNSFQEFVQVFGAPVAGNTNDDISRNGNSIGATYGAYAAQAWLRNNAPLTFVRLVGQGQSGATPGAGAAANNGGVAGYKTTATDPARVATASGSSGGAWGLWVIQSGSETQPTGTLGAIFYMNTGSLALSGTVASGSNEAPGALTTNEGLQAHASRTNTYIKAAAAGTWKAEVIGAADGAGSATTSVSTKFNFDASSQHFIRNVFNTNPTLANDSSDSPTPTASKVDYWLGETFEDEVNNLLGTSATHQYAFIAPLDSGSMNGGDVKRNYADPKTGWFFSQDLTSNTGSYLASNMQRLFRIVGLNTGRWASRNLKISIADLKASPSDFDAYGTFSVLVRAMDDTDNRPKIIEQYNNCNLNPQSENYIARKIGDKYRVWQDDDRRYVEYGNHDTNSDYIRVEMNTAVDEATTDPQLLPFGVFGPPIFKPFKADSVINTNNQTLVTGGIDYATPAAAAWTVGTVVSGNTARAYDSGLSLTFQFPTLRLRHSASEGSPTDPRNVYFGVDTTFNRSGKPSLTIGGYTGPKPAAISDANMWGPGTALPSNLKYSYVFTLDDIVNTDKVNSGNELTGTNVYTSGSRHDSALRNGLTYVNAGSGSWKNVIDVGANQFTTVMAGGFDGLNIKEADPFRNTQWDGTDTELTSYTFNSVKVAIDSLRDPENVEFDLCSMPGLTDYTLSRNIVDMCTDRGDALAVIDLKGGYEPPTETSNAIAQRIGSVNTTINNAKQNLQINSSFACAYYPWVQIKDTINGAVLWVPPSVAAIGAMSYGQKAQALWFAPAGFTRGGLSANNAAGVPVVGVRQRLVSKDRDKLYDANINPIAQFPAEGIVIFGQKTLQMTPSALDRINVRRLLIFLKRQISKIAATLLFDQNVETTWNRFRGRVGPLLADVKAGLGLEDYKLVLDDTTTTPDLIDRNIMYAQIFLKPARSIEFIAIDFVITDSGAAFED